MARIDNHQASIQSRLVSLPASSNIPDCCHLAAYLCSTMLRCKKWRSSTIPVSKLVIIFFHLDYHMSPTNFRSRSPIFRHSYFVD
jgi:hypothetical protein